MEPYETALEWIKTGGLSEKHCKSEEPEERKLWAKFQKQDPEAVDMLIQIEANKFPALMAQSSGEVVADQVVHTLFFMTQSDRLSDAPPQQHCSHLPYVWEGDRCGGS